MVTQFSASNDKKITFDKKLHSKNKLFDHLNMYYELFFLFQWHFIWSLSGIYLVFKWLLFGL